MMGGVTIFIMAVLVIALWVVIEFSKMKHKIYAIFLIGMILFFYLSATFVFKDKAIDYSSVSGLTVATEMYLGFLKNVGINIFSLTGHATKMNWISSNSSIVVQNVSGK